MMLQKSLMTATILLNVPHLALAQQPTAPVRYAQAAPPPAGYLTTSLPRTATVSPPGDIYGFTSWLNGVRKQYGLSAVGHDPNLSAWAAQNNAHQQSRGLGHFVMGPARRQNAAMGNYASIGAMWLASPAHRAALLDPSIRWIGIAGAGAYWTFNGN